MLLAHEDPHGTERDETGEHVVPVSVIDVVGIGESTEAVAAGRLWQQIDNTLDMQFAGHMVCKKYGIVNTENLAHLDQLLNQRFIFFGLPLHLRDGTGSPIRAVAWFPEG